MAIPLFPNGLNGLSDSKWSGIEGSADKIVGVDFRTTPGVMQAHQAMAKNSGATVTELCKARVEVSDGSILWFSSESGKIWRELSGTYTLVHTTVPTSGSAACLDAVEYDGDIYWSTQSFVHKIALGSVGGTWANEAWQNFGTFKNGDDTYHPMKVQNLELFIGDKYNIAKVENPNDEPSPTETMGATLGTAVRSLGYGVMVNPSGSRFPTLRSSAREVNASASSLTKSFAVTPGPNRILVVATFAWRTNNTNPEHPTGVTFDGGALSSPGSIIANLGDNQRVCCKFWSKVSPDVKTANIVATWAATEVNIGMHVFLFNEADGLGGLGSQVNNLDTTSNTIADLVESEDFQTRLMCLFSETATHTPLAGQLEVHTSTNNTVGTDSSSILGFTTGTFQDETEFAVKTPERITTLEPFDIDLLVGTKIDNKNSARVLRWDTVNSGWSAEDDVAETGINAFIRDDNFVYVQAGDYGRLYFYNGEKMEPHKRIPGDWSPSKTARVYANSVGFHLGLPVFGISNVSGNPLLQGIYGFGSYSSSYPKVLSLDFPLLETAGLTIGAIVTRGADLYVAYKTATDVGICKLNWSAKYASAHIETRMLTHPKVRSDNTIATRYFADYVSLPTSTGITLGVKTKYDTNYTSLTVKNDTTRMQVRADYSTPKIANLQIRIGLTVSSNSSPIIENIAYE